MLAALDLLGALPGTVKIAVLGQMRELGGESDRLHRLVGEKAAATATHIVAVGARCRELLRRARDCGIGDENLWFADSAKDALDTVRAMVDTAEHDCTVLVKGSRFTHMERVGLGLSGVPVTCALGDCTLYVQCSKCPKLTA
jgi:UDP-N-acetylmuramoyl-tripeptide--D-alanyl-D-alanine ligase